VNINKSPQDLEFDMGELEKYPNFFMEHEKENIRRWGKKAIQLMEGVITPNSDKETYFIKMIKNEVPPKTQFHALWLKYLKWTKINKELAQFKEEVQRNKSWIKSAQEAAELVRQSTDSRIERLTHRINWLEQEYEPDKIRAERLLREKRAENVSNQHEYTGNDWREQK